MSCESDRGAPAGGPATQGADAAALLREAGELARSELFHEAARLLRERSAGLGDEDLRSVKLAIARNYLRVEAAELAGEVLDGILAAAPGDPEALLLRGEQLRQAAQFGEAVTSLRAGLASRPDDADGALALARALYRLGEAREAVQRFERYFELAATSGPARTEAGDLRLEYARALALDGRLDASADELARLLIDRPLESSLYSELARVQYRRGRRDAGRFLQQIYTSVSQDDHQKNLEDALQRSGMTTFWLGQRAFNRLREKRFLEAVRAYERARALETTDARSHIFSAQLLSSLFRRTDALAALDDALRRGLKPESGIHDARGAVLEARGERDAAETAYSAAYAARRREGDLGGVEKGQADEFGVCIRRAANLVEAGRPRDAFAVLDAADAARPDQWQTRSWRGKALLGAGEINAALEELRAARTRVEGTSASIEIAAALVRARAGDPPGAFGVLESILGNEPGNAEAYDAIEELVAGGLELPEEALTSLQARAALEKRVEQLAAQIDARPLDAACGALLIELGAAKLQLRDTRVGLDTLFFGVDLAPESADGCRVLLTQLRQNQDVFLRLRFLDRLLATTPHDVAANLAVATITLKLDVLLDDGLEAARRLEGLQPGAESSALRASLEAAVAARAGGASALPRRSDDGGGGR